MESLRKYTHWERSSGREVTYLVGSTLFKGVVQISEILNYTDDDGRDITFVYVMNRRRESCIWKKIIVTLNNIIELEFDWKEVIG